MFRINVILITGAVVLTFHQVGAEDLQRLKKAYPPTPDRTETLPGPKGEIQVPYSISPPIDDKSPKKPDEKGNVSKPLTDEELCRRMCKLLKPSEIMPRCLPCY